MGVGVGVGGTTISLRRNQLPGLLPLMPPWNRRYSNGPAVTRLASWKAPPAERVGSSTSTTRIPLPKVRPPVPPALRMKVFVAPPAPTAVPSTTKVSDSVAAPPWLSTVSSFSIPPLEIYVPPPPIPGVEPPRPPVIINTSPGAGLAR